VTAFVLFAAFSAIFISFLAVRRFDLPFKDFQGLLQDGRYVLGVIKNSEREAYFKVNFIGLLPSLLSYSFPFLFLYISYHHPYPTSFLPLLYSKTVYIIQNLTI
jgi:hypothetical protein